MSDKKDLSYYLAHPDEIPTDPKVIEKLANEHMQAALDQGAEPLTVERFVPPDDTPKVEGATKAEPAKAEADAKAAAEDAAAKEAIRVKEEADARAKVEAEAKAKMEAKPDGILAKDGKNLIPYSQLELARDRASRAETAVKAQADEIARLKAAKPGEGKTEVVTLTDEDLTALEVDSPTLAKVLRGQQETIKQLTGTVEALRQHTQGRIATEQAEVKSEIQAAIDANPTLAGWQAQEDQTMWDKASAFDLVLRELPEYAEVPFEERFKKVVELTQSAINREAPKPAETPAPQRSTAEIKAAAEAALAKKQPPVPRSLSDIPGGAPPAADERERVEQMSPTELGNKFLGMTKDQMDAYLATL